MTDITNPTSRPSDPSTCTRDIDAGAAGSKARGVGPLALTADWKAVLKRAWSIRFMALAFLFSALEIALPMLGGLMPIAPGVFAAMTGISTGAAFVSRLVAQRNLEDRT